jgi:TPR repeat protein
MSNYDTPKLTVALDSLSKGDYSAAVRLLDALAKSGNPKAQCNLATCYQLGLGVKADGLKAVELYKTVAEQNIREEHLSAVAYNNMATIYISGVAGIEPDCHKAAEYQKLSRSLDFPMSAPRL